MRRIVAISGTIVFLDAMLFGAIIPLLPHFADRYDLSKLEAGLLFGAYGGGALLGGIPGGLLVGRIGPKRGVLAGLVVLSLASVGFALAGGPLALGVARFAQGVSRRPPGPPPSRGSR
jgi:MFS family permease